MKVPADNTKANPWYPTAVATAVVGGAFAVIICSLLVINFAKSRIIEPKREEKLEAMKTQLRMTGVDKQLISQVRQLDLKIRQDKIRRLDFNRKGGWLLLGSIAVFLIGIKTADAISKSLPKPQLLGDNRQEQIRQAMLTRWAVTASLVILGSISLFIVTRPSIVFVTTDMEAALYPSA